LSRAGIYGSVALAAAVLGFLLGHRWPDQPARLAEAQAPVAVSAPRALPEELPDFTLADRAGTPRSIRSWPGKSMVVNFWATWCAPCRREIPLLKELQTQYAAAGFQVVGVAVDFRDAVIDYAERMAIDYPLLIGEQDGLDAVNAFGVDVVGFPFTVFTDVRGRIVTLHLGELTRDQAGVIFPAIDRINRGEATLASARTEIAAGLQALAPADS